MYLEMGDPVVDLKKDQDSRGFHQPNHEKSTVQGALYGRSGPLSRARPMTKK